MQVIVHQISFDVTFLILQEYQILSQMLIQSDNNVNNKKRRDTKQPLCSNK